MNIDSSAGPILHAYRFDGKGGGVSIPAAQIASSLADTQMAWVHLDGAHADARGWIKQELTYLDAFVIDALLAEETRPRMALIEDGVLVILRGVNLNAGSDPEDMVSVRVWIDQYRIISIRRRRLKAVSDIVDRLERKRGPKDGGDFMAMMASHLFDHMQPVLTLLDEQTDDIEEQVLETADTDLREKITNVRKQAILFRRYMAPQRDAIGQLRMANVDWLGDTHRLHLQESYNEVTRYVEDLDAIRERAQIVKDELASVLADRTNRNMYVLSVVAAIFLPLGFLTGLFGVNIGGMPGVDADNAFAVFCTSMIVLVAMEIALFRKLKWF